MSKYTVIAILLSFLWLYIGTITIINDYRNRINYLFSLMCLTMLTWNFAGGLAYSIDGMDTFRLLSKTSFVGFFLFFPLNLHFYLTISNTVTKLPYIALNYLAGLVLSVCQFITYFLFSDIVKYANEWTGIINYGSVWLYISILYLVMHSILSFIILFSDIVKYANEWTGIINYGSVWLYISILYLVMHSILSFIILIRWHGLTENKKEKIYSISILIFFNIANTITVLSTFILPAFKFYRFQFAGFALFNVYVFCLFFLISRFRFLNIGNTLFADEIISSINDLVFILDMDLKIRSVNRKGNPFFPDSMGRTRNMFFTDIIKENDDLKQKLIELRERKTGSFMLPVNYVTDSGYLLTNSYFSEIRDRFDDPGGFIVISNEIREIKEFQRKFHITGRELEIIEHIITGLSYAEISSKLVISERTVERHLTNIYNKIGINNRIELFRIAGEYNIRI